MYNARVQRRQSRKRSCRRNRRMNGGGAGQGYSFGASVDPANPGLGSATVVPSGGMHCGNALGGRIHDNGTMGGVPGFGGKIYGGRRSSSSDPIDSLMKMVAHKGGSRSGSSDPIDSLMKMVGQTGGAYTMSPLTGSNPFMNRTYSGCGEGAFATRNPLNEVVASTITAPPALKGGRRCWSRRNRQAGGAPVDGMVYAAPPSGYTFAPSNSSGGSAGTLGDGRVPFAVHVPYTAQPSASPACLKTGGSRRRRNRKGSRKSCRN